MTPGDPRAAAVAPDVTCDAFLGGKVTLLQPSEGYRAGLDAVLLAAALDAEPGGTLAEAGSGAGAALLCAAARLGGRAFHGFERDAAMTTLCRESILRNDMTGRVDVTVHDVSERPLELENRFDQAFSNPPFFDPGRTRPPAPGKTAAYMAETPLRQWVLFLAHIARPGGRLTLIHRASELATILDLLVGRSGEIEVLPVRPAPATPASRVLVRARKGLRRGALTLHDGLTLHESPGGPLTARAQAILTGTALEWR